MEIPKLMQKWERHEVNPKEEALVRWLLLLEADDREELRQELEEIAMEDPIMKQAFVLWEEVSRDPSKRYEYEARRKAILDHHSLIRDADLREKKAAAEADLNAKKGMAKKLLAIGMDETKILELTELSEAELEELKKSPH